MKKLSLFWLVALALALPLPALAAGNPIDTSLGDLRWGMSTSEVTSFLVRKLNDDYAERMKKASGFQKEQLKRELDGTIADLKKSLVSFSGRPTQWDSSVVEGEFTHGNQESMLVYRDGQSQNFYFFFDDKLWKWYKAFDSRAFGGRNFKKFNKAIGGKFGKGGRVKEGVLNESGKSMQWVEFITRNTRLRAVDNTRDHDKYALIFEDMQTVRSLKSLRANTVQKKRSNDSALASAKRDDDSDRGSTMSTAPGVSGIKQRKSIFADESQGETEAEYRARMKREKAEAMARQRAMHNRRADREQGKVLKDIGVEDDDPLNGL